MQRDTKVLELHVLSDILLQMHAPLRASFGAAYAGGNRVFNEPIPLIVIDSSDPEKLIKRI